jgi:inorganic pyrophosphatase
MSPWHDIPLYAAPPASRIVHMVVEIPKWTRDKFEVITTEHLNPIKQDVEEGDRLRVCALAVFFSSPGAPRAPPPSPPLPPPPPQRADDYGDMLFNYGMIPQTYEDPTVDCPYSGLRGDDDPLDIIDLGHKQHQVGKVLRVRVLGILGMIDDGQTDWKVLGISTSDPLADRVHTLADAEREMPGAVRAATLWLRRYKVLKKGKENTFLYDGVCQDEAFAMQIIEETNAAWERMLLRAEAEAAKEGGGLAGNSIARARSKGSSDRLAQLAASEK